MEVVVKNIWKWKKYIRKVMLLLYIFFVMSKMISFFWLFFLYLLNKEYLVNNRVKYGFICSGMLLLYYVWFIEGVGIGKIFK